MLLKNTLVFCMLSVFLLVFSSTSLVLAEDPLARACREGRASAACQEVNSNPLYGPTGLITRATEVLSVVVGIVAVIMIIVGGFKYVTSSGDANNIKSAKDTILYAIVGIVIALLARSIVVFVLQRL